MDSSLEYSLPSEATDNISDEDFDFPSTLVVFTETKTLELANKFRRDADAYYVEAKRSTVASIAQIPYWMYGVLVVLGWNEAMTVLFNPMYFTFLLIALASSSVTFSILRNDFDRLCLGTLSSNLGWLDPCSRFHGRLELRWVYPRLSFTTCITDLLITGFETSWQSSTGALCTTCSCGTCAVLC